MKCREARELLVALSNDEVTRSERLLTQAHLAGCPACRTEYEALTEVRRRLTTGLKTRAASAVPPPQAWAGIQGRVRRRVRAPRRWVIPFARLASGAAMAVVLFAASFALNPLTRARLVSEAATATPSRTAAQPAATATPVVGSEPGVEPAAATSAESRRELVIERAELSERSRNPSSAPARPPRRGADRYEANDPSDALENAPVIEETDTPCNACTMLN